MANLVYGGEVSQEDVSNFSVTVRVDTHKVKSRGDWVYDIRAWCEENNIDMKWLGELTIHRDGRDWYEYDCLIKDEHERTLFMLKWA